MEKLDAELQAAEDHAAALHTLGWEVGAGASIWARAIVDELDRHDRARGRFEAQKADREAWEQFHGSAFVLVVAIAQVLAFEERLRKLTGDAELAKARKRFDFVAPHARDLRDVAVHLDAYAVGEGDRQQGRERRGARPVTDRHVRAELFWTNPGHRTFLELGGDRVELHSAAQAALTLADVVERVREKQLALAEKRAQEAFQRRWGPF